MGSTSSSNNLNSQSLFEIKYKRHSSFGLCFCRNKDASDKNQIETLSFNLDNESSKQWFFFAE